MQSLSGRKTESYFTDTNLIKTCKLLNLFRYHCNDPSLASELPSHDCIGPPGQRHGCKKKSSPRQKPRAYVRRRAWRRCDFICVAAFCFFDRHWGIPFLLLHPLHFCHFSCIVAASAPRAYREAGPLQRATRAARPSAQLKKGSTETVLSLATLLFLSPFL